VAQYLSPISISLPATPNIFAASLFLLFLFSSLSLHLFSLFQFKEQVRDLLPTLPAQSDHFLLRWLRGEMNQCVTCCSVPLTVLKWRRGSVTSWKWQHIECLDCSDQSNTPRGENTDACLTQRGQENTLRRTSGGVAYRELKSCTFRCPPYEKMVDGSHLVWIAPLITHDVCQFKSHCLF